MTPRPAHLLLAAGGFALPALVLTIVVAVLKAPLPGDIAIARNVQTWDWFSPLASGVNQLGNLNLPVLLTLAGVSFLVRHFRPTVATSGFVRLTAMLLAMYWVNAMLKLVVRSPRPALVDGIIIDRARDSFGFPSGHVYADVLIYGSLAILAWSRFRNRIRVSLAIAVAAVAVIVLAGPARIYAGAHWPSDVIGGYLWGFAALCLYWSVASRLGANFGRSKAPESPAIRADDTPVSLAGPTH